MVLDDTSLKELFNTLILMLLSNTVVTNIE